MKMKQVFAADDRPWPRNNQRTLAVGEVVFIFSLVHLFYRSFNHFTVLGRTEGAAGLNFSTGSVMILFTFAMLVLFRRNFMEYGLT